MTCKPLDAYIQKMYYISFLNDVSIVLFYFIISGSEIVDQDSLDGQLPSSSRSLVQDNPAGIPPTPPGVGGGGNPPPPPPPMNGGNFTKGPAAKNKKHRKLNRETEESMSEDETENNSGGGGNNNNNPPNSKNSNNSGSTSQNSQVKSSQNTSSNPRYVFVYITNIFIIILYFILCLANPPRLQIQLQKQPAVPSISIPSVEFYGRDANLCKYFSFYSFFAISNLVKEVIWHVFGCTTLGLLILNAHLKHNLIIRVYWQVV